MRVARSPRGAISEESERMSARILAQEAQQEPAAAAVEADERARLGELPEARAVVREVLAAGAEERQRALHVEAGTLVVDLQEDADASDHHLDQDLLLRILQVPALVR